jgi:DUF2934 family protein
LHASKSVISDVLPFDVKGVVGQENAILIASALDFHTPRGYDGYSTSGTAGRLCEIPQWRFLMANEKEPKGRPSSSGTSARNSRSKAGAATQSDPTTKGPVDPEAMTARKPVSTSEPTAGTARNATIQGNGVISSEDIRQRAYELYEQRGRVDGFHEQDWHEAEAQIRGAQRNGDRGNILHKKKSA